MEYRREIDGLRALAVLPVLLFHAGVETFSGGFVGVDVFFVISGYLITSIIVDEKRRNDFSLAKFYERRARRILPALFLVMAISVIFAWHTMLPRSMMDLGKSLIAVSVFSSNFLFWRESGYFDAAAELKPLLHTWSLAVEEQFYLLFPLLLLALLKVGKQVTICILALFSIASLFTANWGAGFAPMAAFYLLPMRAWELLVGSMLALGFVNRNFSRSTAFESPLLQQLLGVVGLLLVGWSIFAFDKNTPFPGFYALVPTLGTALVIQYARSETIVGKILGSKAFVGVGLISYSAYLWHQPILVFARHGDYVDFDAFGLLLFLSSVLVLSYCSWRFVELPLRNKNKVSRNCIFVFSGVGTVAFFSFGMIGCVTDGYYFRDSLREKLGNVEYRLRPNRGLSEICEKSYTTDSRCRTSDDPEILVWGDSQAMHLVPAILASNPNAKIMQSTVSGCGPFLEISPYRKKEGRSWEKNCIETNDKVFELLQSRKSFKYVILSSSFSQYLDADAKFLTRHGSSLSGEDSFRSYVIETVQKLKSMGLTPIVVSPAPRGGGDIGGCIMKEIFSDKSKTNCDFSLSEAEAEQGVVFRFLESITENVRVVWLSDVICPNQLCKASVKDVIVYNDGSHLSYEGSDYVGRKLDFYGMLSVK